MAPADSKWDEKVANGCILDPTGKPKMEIPNEALAASKGLAIIDGTEAEPF